MGVVEAWRSRLAKLAVVLFVVGTGVATWMFAFESGPYNDAIESAIAPVETLLVILGPSLAVAGAAALVVRWRLPKIAEREPGERFRSIALLATALPLASVSAGVVLTVIFVISYALVGCSTQGC